MRLSLAEPKYLKDSISIISEMVNEARFKITKDAIELIAMDPANVSMVIFKLLSSAFVEYKLDNDVELSINLGNLKQILRRAKPSDIVTLEMVENRLKVELKGTSKRTFLIPTIDVEEKEQKIPDLKFPVTVNTRCEILNDSIEDADIVAESVSFIADANNIIIEAESDMTKASNEIKADDDTKIVNDSKDKIKSKYSIEYLKKMMGGSKLSDNVTIQFNNDYPLKIEYKTVDKVLLSFILAPRVEND